MMNYETEHKNRRIRMKIVHICLAGPFTDGWNYQDNMISKYHKKMGFDVTVIASQWIRNEGEIVKTSKTD